MLNIKNAIKALTVSVLLAVILSLGGAVLFSSGVSIDPDLDWEKVNAMPYSEALAYIDSHTKTMSAWEALEGQMQWFMFISPGFFALIVLLFCGCLALLFWVRNERAS